VQPERRVGLLVECRAPAPGMARRAGPANAGAVATDFACSPAAKHRR
jgi:hypothetical protein